MSARVGFGGLRDRAVCIDVVSGIEKKLTEEDKKDIVSIEEKIGAYCKQKSLNAEQKKICYHIDPIKREVSRPLSFGMPPEDICIRKLNKKNTEFCSVRYNADKAKASTIDPSKMRIAQLKAFLAERGLKCTGCYEKEGMAGMALSRVDYVRKVKEAMNEEL